MKKLFYSLILVVFFLNNCLAMQSQPLTKTPEESMKKVENNIDMKKFSEQVTFINSQIKNLQEALKSKDQTKIKQAYSILSEAKEQVKNLCNFATKNIDSLLPKNGTIKTLLILGTLFTAARLLLTSEQVEKPIEYISSTITKSTVDVGTSIGTGVVDGLIEGTKDNWWELLKIGGIASAISTAFIIPGVFITESVKVIAPAITKLLLLKIHLTNSQ